MTKLFLICHFVTCFATLISLIIGLTRKEQAQVKTWHTISRVCCAIMIIGGIGLEVSALPVQPVAAVIKCVLGFMTIYLIEKTFRYKKNNELNKGRVICVFSSYALTVVCGVTLFILMKHYGLFM